MKSRCNVKKRNGTYCKAWAMPNGKCRVHGGTSPKAEESKLFKHGMYSRYKTSSTTLTGLQEYISQDPDPLNTEPEIKALRAVLFKYLEENIDKLTPSSINQIRLTLETITKLVERIYDIRIKKTISLDLLSQVFDVMGELTRDALQRHNPDQAEVLADEIAREWARVRINPSKDNYTLLEREVN